MLSIATLDDWLISAYSLAGSLYMPSSGFIRVILFISMDASSEKRAYLRPIVILFLLVRLVRMLALLSIL